MPTLFMKLPHEDKVLRPDCLRRLVLGDQTVGFTLDIGLNYYRGMPLSSIEKLDVIVDGAPISPELMLFEFNEKLFMPDQLAMAFTEFWDLKRDLRLKVFNGGLAAGDHEVELVLHVRNVYMQFGPGAYGMVDSSVTRTLTLTDGPAPARPSAIEASTGTVPARAGVSSATIGTIEQAVSLYGFEQRLVDDPDYGLADMFAELNSLGVRKYELIGSMVFSQYPRPTAAEIAAVRELSERYGVEINSYGGYLDKGKITGHDATDADLMLDITADLMTARDLGATFLRAGDIPLHLMPAAAAMAERYGVRIGIEVHAPHKPSDDSVQAMLKTMNEIDSPYLGLVPDFGCFIERPAQPALDRHIANGADPELLDYVIAHRHDGLDEAGMQAKIAGMGGGEAEKWAISEMFGFLSFGPADIEGFKTLLHRTQYFHSKFYHVTEDLQDPQIPVDRLLAAIVESGFEGVLLSEYEGHAFHLDDAHEQLERHLRLEQKILTGLANREPQLVG
ncbi:C-glycoside deglycosidase beta subunit domain-containing protein [Tessaracoccus palaemonis]|uniref:C-deglycosylation enzyme beta subunit n=1 Tax=Tessaracoccus palaemonis TaxID=2829499 RepID=A0ABX8SI82_9ACTN|nr:DUF6379 domain-containing protein [Tessaracoccus palaemonis]QXT63096.1 sugar phosphate isomerase/epimerase [Tessaracoccus palaemonis]